MSSRHTQHIRKMILLLGIDWLNEQSEDSLKHRVQKPHSASLSLHLYTDRCSQTFHYIRKTFGVINGHAHTILAVSGVHVVTNRSPGHLPTWFSYKKDTKHKQKGSPYQRILTSFTTRAILGCSYSKRLKSQLQRSKPPATRICQHLPQWSRALSLRILSFSWLLEHW